jgi:diguanylate cyclase (GGDEF)-like protein/PAS domain S-box-containing protein
MAPEIDTTGGVAAVQDQDLLRALMDTLPDLIYFKDLHCRFTRINKAMGRYFGLADPSEVLGKTDFDFYARPQAQIAFDREQEIIRTGQPLFDFEERMVGRDGREVWFSVCKLPLRDADGKIVGTYGLSRDITSHKQQEEKLRHSEALYHSLVESLPQCIFRKDLNLNVVFANQKLCQSLGVTLQELMGKNDFDFYPPELARKYQEDDRWVIKTGKVFETVEEHQDPGKPKQWVHVVKAPIFDFRGYVVGVEGIFWDETELTMARQKLEESQQRYALAVEGANDGIWDWNIQTNEVYYSRRWKEMLGYEEHEIGKKLEDWMKRVHPDDLQSVRAALHAHLQGRTAHFQSEHRVLHRQKAYRWVLSRGLAVRDASGKAIRMAGSQTDVTDRKRAEEELAHQAFYDTLTDLPNRALFLDRLSHAIRRAKRRVTGASFAVLFLDVDRFKDVNDSLGHALGDVLLKATARRLEETVRPGDTVARLGGDEFAILLDDLRAMEDAVDVAERVLRAMKEPFQLNGHEMFATASIGIAPGSVECGPEDLLRDADTAMYRAKERGRACYEVFDRDMHSRAVARLQLETDLRKAIERREFRVYYQPIVSIKTGRVSGFEALARWEHPQRGLVSPSEFIPLAEETGLVIPIDFWVLDQACRQTLQWHGRHPAEGLTINVNLSTKHFSHPNLVTQVEEILKETGLDPTWLRLEITESVILEDAHSIREMLQRLKGMKIKLYLDDFGTGYSSLGYLHRFPIDSLKIHHSFVGQLGQQEGRGELVKTITTLATNLDMGVVAEGVETKEQLRTLRDLKCEKVQGFLFSKPVPAEQAEALIGRDLLNGDKAA